jgi:hypothetical protein
MLEENNIIADALRKIGQVAVPPDATLRDWKDAFAEAQRIADEARRRAGVMNGDERAGVSRIRSVSWTRPT